MMLVLALAVLAALVNAWAVRPKPPDAPALRRLLTMVISTRDSGWIAAAQKVAEQKLSETARWSPEVHQNPAPSPMRTEWRWE